MIRQTFGMNQVASITTDASGNIYVGGSFQSSFITFGIDTLINAGGSNHYDMFIAKLSSGKYIWPGDVNNDGMANNDDLLPIGLYYGQIGAPRMSISWLQA